MKDEPDHDRTQLSIPMEGAEVKPPTCRKCGASVKRGRSRCPSCSRRRRGSQVQSDGSMHRPDPVVYDCTGHAGVCDHVGCPRNLAIDVTDTGALVVPPFADRPSVVVPAVRGGRQGTDLYALVAAKGVEEAIAARQAWLVALTGSTCVTQIVRTHGSLTQRQVGLLMGVDKQAIDQAEERAMAVLRPMRAVKAMKGARGVDVMDALRGRK